MMTRITPHKSRVEHRTDAFYTLCIGCKKFLQ